MSQASNHVSFQTWMFCVVLFVWVLFAFALWFLVVLCWLDVLARWKLNGLCIDPYSVLARNDVVHYSNITVVQVRQNFFTEGAAHAKPDFNWLSGPRNRTWKRTCGISCLRSLLPCGDCNAAPPRQHSPTRCSPRYSATPWYVLIQLPNVIDTMSKRWRSKRAFNTSPSHIFP